MFPNTHITYITQITKIIFIFFLLILSSEILSAHQEHSIRKNENRISSKSTDESVTSLISQEIKTKSICDSDDLKGSECCCCINGICFQMNKTSDCETNKKASHISCSKHCENAMSDGNNIITRNVRNQNIYKINFLYNFAANKDLIILNPTTLQKTITQSTPTYISIHSFLV